jgi:phospholipase C
LFRRLFLLHQPGSPLYEKGVKPVDDFVAAFRQDVESGQLPAVSYLIAPQAMSEHAANHPPAGEDLSARILQVLQDNPVVYAKTVFILNYDEGGQFFDHHWPPSPPVNAADGVSTVTTQGEIYPGMHACGLVDISIYLSVRRMLQIEFSFLF